MYQPTQHAKSEKQQGAEYLAQLLSGYGDTFYQPVSDDLADPETKKRHCVERLKHAAQFLGSQLQGLSYELVLSATGETPPIKGVDCRITVKNDLSVTIETKDN